MIYAVNKRTKEHRGWDDPLAAHDDWLARCADADGWIPWPGGECPLPLDAQVEARCADGPVCQYPLRATSIPWGRILAYRPILDAKSEAPAWDGEGLPPVGCECEAEDDYGRWQRCRIVGVDGEQIWVDFEDDGYATRHINDIELRPIRSAEQIAAEIEMDEATKMLRDAGAQGLRQDNQYDTCRALYRAGYRKTEDDA